MRQALPILDNLDSAHTGHKHSGADSCGSPKAVAALEAPSLMAGADFSGNVLLVTLGCAKNLVDSEVMLGVLKAKGFRSVIEPSEADLIVVNTCAFLESAVKEGIDTILDLTRWKEEGRCRRLIVAGCMVERYRDDLTSALPEVDRFLSTDELLQVADDNATSGSCFDEARRPYFLYDESMPRKRSTAGHSAFIKIAEGCDRPCAFCIIPKIRGSFRSRPVESVIAEAKELVADGVRELNLVAQDLTAYGSDLESRNGDVLLLPKLIRSFSEMASTKNALAQSSFWVRLFYAYPVGVTPELIDLIVDSPVVCNYLDLPLQHISHTVLKAMRRPLGERRTRELLEMIRRQAPQIALRTTFVVGFPGETEEDIELLRSYVLEGHFTHVGAFAYSQESEAASFTFPNQVPEKEREARKKIIMEAQQQVVRQRLESFVGKKVKVLVDGTHAESDLLLVGRTEWQGPETDGEVIINELPDDLPADLSGKFVTVEITETAGYDLVGRVV